jgi:hypothetical protein
MDLKEATEATRLQFGFLRPNGEVEVRTDLVESIAKTLGWAYTEHAHSSLVGKISRDSVWYPRVWDAFAEGLFGPKPEARRAREKWVAHAEAQIGPRPKHAPKQIR